VWAQAIPVFLLSLACASGSDGGESNTASTGGAGSGSTNTGAGGSAGKASCEQIPDRVQAELEVVATCEPGDSCEYRFIGSGCSDSPLPCCGFPSRVGADLAALQALNDSYMDQSCAGNAIACCACLMPAPLECVDKVCTQE
jgi:hypothetical protein